MAPNDRRDLERARRKQEILQAARAVFAEDGYNRATVDAVARRAELGKGTIYLYFETKEAILGELTLQALGELGEQLQAAADRCSPLHPDQRLRAMGEAYLAFARHAPDYFRLLNAFDHGGFQEGISSDLRQRSWSRVTVHSIWSPRRSPTAWRSAGLIRAMRATLQACFGPR